MIGTYELEARKAAFDKAEEIRAQYAEMMEEPDLEVRFDRRAIRSIARHVNSIASGPHKKHWSDEKVGRWVNDPNRHSPWIDWVAIERALKWDSVVISRLTDLEVEEFVRQLATDLDPWGEVLGGSREKRFQALPESERSLWRERVSRVKQKAAA